ncbi:MAG TPA: YegP family protein [Steroidobacteraceae bacterium]|nr:YegP family protein [Steroidobacteraceae bacterium]
MAGYFELKKTDAGAFRFNLKAGNHEVILTSQSYTTQAAAEAGIESVRANAAAGRFEERSAKDGSPYFVLLATNGQIVGQSEMYSSAAAMQNGIESVKKNAPDATVKVVTDVA